MKKMQVALWHFFDAFRDFSILGGHWDVYCSPYEIYVLMEIVTNILSTVFTLLVNKIFTINKYPLNDTIPYRIYSIYSTGIDSCI